MIALLLCKYPAMIPNEVKLQLYRSADHSGIDEASSVGERWIYRGCYQYIRCEMTLTSAGGVHQECQGHS